MVHPIRELARAMSIIAQPGTEEPSLGFGACVSGLWPCVAQWVVPVRTVLQMHAKQIALWPPPQLPEACIRQCYVSGSFHL